jgi:putative ABC transport system permease protein
VGAGYFDMAETRALRGRLFTDADVFEGEPVAVVEQRLAERYWPGQDPIGKRLRWTDQTETRWQTVVGVVPDIKQAVSLEFAGDYPVVYTPYRQEPLRGMGLMIRASMEVEAVARLLRGEVQRLDPNLPIFDVATLQSVTDERLVGFRVVSVLFLLLGGIALFLACIGIYAVMAFAVGRRQREIGIRVALGAQRHEVLGLVLRRALLQTVGGLGIGFLVALAWTRLLGMYLYEVSPSDPATFSFTVMVLAVTALFAAAVPARRAGRIDPLEALRAL